MTPIAALLCLIISKVQPGQNKATSEKTPCMGTTTENTIERNIEDSIHVDSSLVRSCALSTIHVGFSGQCCCFEGSCRTTPGCCDESYCAFRPVAIGVGKLMCFELRASLPCERAPEVPVMLNILGTNICASDSPQCSCSLYKCCACEPCLSSLGDLHPTLGGVTTTSQPQGFSTI